MQEVVKRAIVRGRRRFRAWLRYRKKRAALPGTTYEILGELFIWKWRHRHIRSMIGERQLEWLSTEDPRIRSRIARQIHVDVLSRSAHWLAWEASKHAVVGLLIKKGGE